MKIGFYLKLAFEGIRKNRRMYLPYILTCTGMVMMYYILSFLEFTDTIEYMRGGSLLRTLFGMGCGVIAFFSCLFLFYTNSFLIRRRKKEFGLYNVLGMGRWNIGRILFWESLLIACVSLGAGLAFGILFSKLAELGLVNLIMDDVTFPMVVPVTAIKRTAAVFVIIFAILFLNAVRQVRFSSAIVLLQGENVGEKPPKANWLLGILGLAILITAYYLAVTIENPLAALEVFFVAVVMVIAATYLIMIAGSVMFCRLLQRKKNYYYQPGHFVSVSSMVYRMKRNGAGLASICILVTMVLVMISSTTCLYFGTEDSLAGRYPREIDIQLHMKDMEALSDEAAASLYGRISGASQEFGVTPEDSRSYRVASITGLLRDGKVKTDASEATAVDMLTGLRQCCFMPLSDYNRLMGREETLEAGEALIYCNRDSYQGDTISFEGGPSFRIKRRLDHFIENGELAMTVISSFILIVPDLETSLAGLEALSDYNGNPMLALLCMYEFDTGKDAGQQIRLCGELAEMLNGDSLRAGSGITSVNCESRANDRQDFYSLNGGFFYLGILLSIVFILAAVLIIYYKQISEGYEDQSRFDVMQKVGMTKREIRRSINSQLLTVFFLPLAFAACHLVFAFPIIQKLLLMFGLRNVRLFALTTVASVVVFALFYTAVYRVTSNAYYNIVSGARER